MQNKLVSAALLASVAGAFAFSLPAGVPFRDGERVVFLGDSITHGGYYHRYVEEFYMTRFPGRNIRWWNAGVGGDASTPCLIRFTDDVAALDPTAIVTMFGMNDANSHTAQTFADSMRGLADRMKAECPRAATIWLKPTPYDPYADIGSHVVTGREEKLIAFSQVVDGIAEYAKGETVDFGTVLRKHLERERRKNPKFTFMPDRVHPNAEAHFLLAWEFLKAQGVPSLVADIRLDAQEAAGGIRILEKALPFPIDAKCRRFLADYPIAKDLSRELVTVAGLEKGNWALEIDGERVLVKNAAEWAKGVDIALEPTPQYRQAEKVSEKLEEYRRESCRYRDLRAVRWWVEAWNGDRVKDIDDLGQWREFYSWLETQNRTNEFFSSRIPWYMRDWEKRGEIVAKMDRLLDEARELAKPVMREWRFVKLAKKPIGYQLDISRCKVPTMAMLKTVVDTLATLGYNQFQLYTEHTFAYSRHEPVWREASPMTPEEIRKLDAYCASKGIELVPNQNSFGHMEHWLRHPGYNDLAEMPRGGKIKESGRRVDRPSVLCPVDPRSEALISGLYDELFPCFRSKYVNVGCDETWELDNTLGTGRSAAAIKEKGWRRVYVDFLRKIHGQCAKRGHVMMFWGDIILHEPELIKELPEDVIALNWGYEDDHPFEAQTAALEKSGRRFIVCPGTSAWGSLFGRTSNMLANIDNGFAAGEKHGAFGYLLADWGDGGHPNPWLASVPALVYLAAKERGETLTRAELAAEIDRLLGAKIGEGLLSMADVYRTAKGNDWNCTEFYHQLRNGPRSGYTFGGANVSKLGEAATAESLAKALEEWDAARRLVDAKGAPEWVKDDIAMLDLLREAVEERMKDRENSGFRAIFEPRYRALWLKHNRIGGLQESLTQLFGVRK